MASTDLAGAAAAWLALVDRGDADASWQAAGASFRAAATASDWAGKLQAARAPLGPLTSRMLAVVETLTLVREDDGQWRVVGYFIR